MSDINLLIVHLVATCTVFGILLVIQVVHYPLFSLVGTEEFPSYEQEHMRLISYVVIAPMLLELVTGAWLVYREPVGIPQWMLICGVALIAVFWISTMVLQGPLHPKLATGFDPDLHRKLVSTNWIRTVASFLRVIVVSGMIYFYSRLPTISV